MPPLRTGGCMRLLKGFALQVTGTRAGYVTRSCPSSLGSTCWHRSNRVSLARLAPFGKGSNELRRFSTNIRRNEAEHNADTDQPQGAGEEEQAIDRAIGTLVPPLRVGYRPDATKIEYARPSEKASTQLVFNRIMLERIQGEYHSYDVAHRFNVRYDVASYLEALMKAHEALGKSKQMSPFLLRLYEQMEEQSSTARETVEKVQKPDLSFQEAVNYDIFRIGPRLEPRLRPAYYAANFTFVVFTFTFFYFVWKGLGALLAPRSAPADGEEA